MKTHIISVVLIAAGLVGCATTASHNLSPLLYVDQPSVSTYLDPDVDLSRYSTFTVLPPSEVTGEPSQIDNEIELKQLLFFVRNQAESKGYVYVKPDENPDLIFSLDGSKEFHQTHIPPRNIVVPRWVPGQTSYSTGSHSGIFSGTAYGNDGSVSGYGTYSGTSSTTTQSSGYMTTDVVTQRGYSVGYWYPALAIAVFDAKSGDNIYLGSGAATSTHADLRVSGQLLAMRLLKDLPNTGVNDDQIYGVNKGRIGTWLVIFTTEGNRYYPAIFRLFEDSAAEKAGLKVYDLIVAINGESTLNMTLHDVVSRVIGTPDSAVDLSVWRMGSLKEYRVKRR